MKKILILAAALILFGAGCAQPQASQVQPVQVPVTTPPAAVSPPPNVQPTSTPVQEVPSKPVEVTADWLTLKNAQYGFEFKYPSGFFQNEPKILVGDCAAAVFPAKCPDITDIVARDQAAAGGDINAIKNNLAAQSFQAAEKVTLNGTVYCLHQTNDAAMMHQYNERYYSTVKDGKCLVADFTTVTVSCDVYLPLENGNTEQEKNYNDCLATNKNQPGILKQVISTFKFTSPVQTGCSSNADCTNGATCMVTGPLIAGQPVRKVCVPPGQAVPL